MSYCFITSLKNNFELRFEFAPSVAHSQVYFREGGDKCIITNKRYKLI